ncbi:MAG TPA: hypothetical protein VFX30_06510 [bacterium]|nr:hypothetical protein [bacterium]
MTPPLIGFGLSFIRLVSLAPLAKGDPPLPPETGRFLQVAGQAALQKDPRSIDREDREIQKVLWKNVTASSKTHVQQEEAMAELKALTSQAGQRDLLAMAFLFEEKFQNHIDLAYLNPNLVFRHFTSVLEPKNVHRLAKRAAGRFGNRFTRPFKNSLQIGMATKILGALLPSLQEKPRRKAVSKLIDQLSSRSGAQKDRVVDILIHHADLISPEEFHAAARKVSAQITRPTRRLKSGFSWDAKHAAEAFARLTAALLLKQGSTHRLGPYR